MTGDSSETEHLLQEAAAGDAGCWRALVGRVGERLRRMVAFRLHERLHGRVDASDVV
jgi:RNA polymerase sigma-70 factor (ECF subfamily)